ncbi:DISEASE RESISTANCE PROTEIN RP [Salix purpurea]|uniref:DISEASE RESISTANCE PROTEIN RP n=1 Tax=Salix purpurea TaxID=77065 RepID=A0A9Q0US88_SALPP|nr:DISEASE RESISTANCE PROTEIN RP [Salix purpurea]
MAEVAVEYLVRKLKDRILFETDKRSAAELNSIKIEFEKLRPYLKNADWRKMMVADNSIVKWVTDVINLVYEVEDVIDKDCGRIKQSYGSLSSLVDFVSEFFNYGTTSNKPQISYKSLLVHVSEKFKELEATRKHLSLYGDITKARHENLIQHSKSSHKLPLTNMIGRNKEFMMLKELLLQVVEADRPYLVAVTGNEGVGKTTLVLRVYESVQKHFDCSAWLSVCGRSITGILRNMAADFSRSHSGMKPLSNLDKKGDKDLANMIQDYLGGVFSILIHYWQKMVWGLLRGRALLQQYVLGEVPWPSTVKLVEKKILHICEGIPLSIATMGSLLSTINLEEVENWNEVLHMLEEANQCMPQSDLIKKVITPVHDFICDMSQKDQIFSVYESTHQVWPLKASHFVAIHGEIDNITPNPLPREIRSFHFFGGRSNQTGILLNLVSKVKLLHVLDLQNIPIDTLPDEIGDLVELRYLDLRNTGLHELPSSLQNLCELQTLDVRNTPVRALPSGFDNLKMLKHLLLADSYGNRVVKLDAEIMFLKDLQTLAGVKLTQNVALGLNHLPKLLKLSVGEVEGGKNSLCLSESINQMKDLNSLTIKCAWRKEVQIQISNPLDNLEKLRVGGWIRDLQMWISRLSSLKYLHLWDCMLNQDPISSLQHLPNLVVLSLSKAFKGKQISCDNIAGYPKLKRLSIFHFEELAEWTKIEEGSMEKLQILTIGWCRKLKLPPRGLESLKDLETLQITRMSLEFAEEAKAISRSSGLNFSVVEQFASQNRQQKVT